MQKNKKGAGLVNGLVMGVAGLVITVIIAFIVISNVSTVDDTSASDLVGSVSSESIPAINGTTYTVAKATETGFGSFSVKTVFNSTNLIPATNYTVGSTGTIVGATGRSHNYTNAITVSYTYTYRATTGTADRMITNMTSGIDNISSKIPTVLLISAVVLILGILVLLWTQYRKMSADGGQI